jgi:DNA primase
MNNLINAKELKDRTSIVDLLSRLGYTHCRKTGSEHIYLSMLRDSDTTPSFSVNDKKGTWYDHGEGKGGNIIDFGLLYWPGSSFQEVLQKIVDITATILPSNWETKRKRETTKEPNYQILDIKDLGANDAITTYLQGRGIWTEAQSRLKEIYYYVEDEQKKRKHFFAAGWQNETGSWEIRSIQDYKGCLGHKAISFIPGHPNRLAVFEGFIDYLSWLVDNPFVKESVLVLNSLSLLQQGIGKAQDFERVTTYFDHDKTGRKATTIFIAAVPLAFDGSSVYEGYNDYNDKLVAGLNPYEINR